MKKLIIIVLIFLVSIMMACDRQVDSRDPVRSLPSSGPVPVNLKALINDGSVSLTWDIADSSEIDLFHIWVARDDSALSNYNLHDSTTSCTIILNDLLINRQYFFQVAAVTLNGVEGYRSENVSARISRLSVSINDGSEFTNRNEVQIRINAPSNASDMIIAEDEDFTNAVWISYSSSVNFILSDGDGTKTVYVKLVFSDGSESGELLSGSIVLDTYARINDVTFSPTDTLFTAGDTILFELNAGENGGEASVSFVGSDPIRLFDDGSRGDLDPDDGIYSGWFAVSSECRLADGIVTGAFTDAAGNDASDCASVSLLNITNPPIPVTLSAVVESTFEIVLSWTESSNSGFSAYRIYRDDSTSVSNMSMLLKTITNASAATYTDTTLRASSTYYYKIYVYNNSGQFTGSNMVSGTTLVNTVPESVELDAFTGDDPAVASLIWSASPEHDFESYRIYRGGSADAVDTLVAVITNSSTTNHNSQLQNGTGRIYFQVFVRDRHGLIDVTGSNVVSVPAPTSSE